VEGRVACFEGETWFAGVDDIYRLVARGLAEAGCVEGLSERVAGGLRAVYACGDVRVGVVLRVLPGLLAMSAVWQGLWVGGWAP